MIKGMFGINIAVKDLEDAGARYEKFLGVTAVDVGPNQFAFPGLKGKSLNVNGFRINLITSTEPDTSVDKFLKKNGEGVFLLSVEVDDIDNDINRIRETGAVVMMPHNASGDFGKVNFVHPKSMAGVQIEVFEPSTDFARSE